MPILTDDLRTKIERRAKRAFELLDQGEQGKVHRISDLTKTGCTYRLRHSGSQSRRGGKRIEVKREPDGKILVIEPPLPPLLDMIDKSKLVELKDHQGMVRAYKVTKKDGTGTQYPSLTYAVGAAFDETGKANTNVAESCAAGINLASLDWVKKEHQPGFRIFAIEFEAQKDLAAIPTGSDGKFRVFRCKVVEELDTSKLGLRAA